MEACQEVESKEKLDDVIINGSTWQAIWHMAWPMLLQMSSVSIASFCDVWIAGNVLGSDAQAAIGLCGQIWFFMILMTVALSAGTTALVSRYWGAREMDMAEKAAKQSMLFGLVFGISSMSLGLLICRPLVAWLGASPEVQELGWQYMRVDLLSQFPFTLCWVSHSLWRAMGNARAPMMNWMIMTCIICVLDFVLCVKPFNFGISGIGAAWLVAAIVGVALNFFQLRKTKLASCTSLPLLFREGVQKEWFVRILKIGIPSCIMDLAWVGGCFLLFLIFAETVNKTACQAAWAIGFRLEEIISCLPLHAISAAVAPIVGQNLGAGKPERAEQAGWQCTWVGLGFTVVIALVLFFGAETISKTMSSDPTVILYSTQYFQVVGLSQPFVALFIILFGAMQGAGYTAWPMWVGIFSLIFLRLPLSWFLTGRVYDGPMGCWMGIAASSVVLGLLALWRYKTGVWKLVKV